MMTPNKQSRAFIAFTKSIEMRDKWKKAVYENMTIEEMKDMGITPIKVVE